MALPVSFPRANINFGKPEGWKDEECMSLPAWKGVTALTDEDGKPTGRDGHVIVSCWKLNKEELDEVIKTGVVWLTLFSPLMIPVCITGENPFE